MEGLGPYLPAVKDGKLYGRGAVDDGYGFYCAITSIKAIQAQKLPCPRIVMLFEGCEESGSRDLPYYMDKLGDKMTLLDYNPKAFTTNEVYGYVNMATREWKDGVQSKNMRAMGQIAETHKSAKPPTGTCWIILDGDLDANWIESMNSGETERPLAVWLNHNPSRLCLDLQY